MKMLVKIAIVLSLVVMLSPSANATNGDNLIAVGPISRSMGGAAIAAPQDAISAVFANPAAMCFGPYCPASQVDFAGTLFIPSPSAKVTYAGQTVSANSERKVYAIPAFGLSVPITSKPPFWRFGLSAYGITGLGVDYKGSSLDGATIPPPPPPNGAGGYPLAAGTYTQLQIMKFAPAIGFQPFEKMSFGAALQIDYSTLDLREGTAQNYGIGVQLGTIYKITDALSFGLSFVTPQNISYDDVVDFDQDGILDNLSLESPWQVGIGLAYHFLDNKLLVEGDVKWLNWSGAKGYDDFDWNDQWVFALGAQYKPMPKLALRLGYNYGTNPVDEHNGWNGAAPVQVQGKTMPTYYYESFRVLGFPAIVEHHITVGLGYELSPKFGLQAGYMHAFKNTLTEEGYGLDGRPASFESSLYEDSVDVAFTWRF
ncbi:MAG: outer membrane protein transport protein [Desulfoferrobacter sp.]